MQTEQICEYCGYSFKPTIRFRQRFCCNSCRVLYNRHKCNRAQYELRRVNERQLKETNVTTTLPNYKPKIEPPPLPKINIRRLLMKFENKFLGEVYSPNELAQSNLLREFTEAKASPDATKEEITLIYCKRFYLFVIIK